MSVLKMRGLKDKKGLIKDNYMMRNEEKGPVKLEPQK